MANKIVVVNLHRPTTVAALTLVATIALGGCAILEPTPSLSPTPTPTVVDTSRLIGEVIDPIGTTWAGKDSGGDDTVLTLNADGTVSVKYGQNAYQDPNDRWRVERGILYVGVFLDDTNGIANYVGTWNPETKSIDAVITTTISNRTLRVTLVKQ